jgi:two-component system, OmpR family, phosphate regulon sensor histidine kinase PhoR
MIFQMPNHTGKQPRWRKAFFPNGIFLISLIALISLGIWWGVFMRSAITRHHEQQLLIIHLEGELLGQRLGVGATEPQLQTNYEARGFQIVPTTEATGMMASKLKPNWPQYSLAVRQDRIEDINEKFRRQRIMWIGEGSLLAVLLGVSVFMLYRLVRGEIKAAAEAARITDLVTHELKTPLAGIRTLLQSIALGRIPAEEQDKVVAMGIGETDRLEHMVENALLRSRLRSRQFELNCEPIVLLQAATLLLEHRARLGAGRSTPTLSLLCDEPMALADKDCLRMILENLLDNAAKYAADNDDVTIEIQRSANMIHLRVIDHGIGIAAENLENIFQPYFREAGTAGAKHGSGLGLSISRDMARRMGGNLSAASDGKGQGACFTLQLQEAPNEG